MNKKTTAVVLGLAVIAFFASGCEDTRKVRQLESQVAQLNQLLLQKDAEIKTLTKQVQIKQKELDSVNSNFNDLIVPIAKDSNQVFDTTRELDSVNSNFNDLKVPIAKDSN